ncbi:MAG TPA: polymer-forming cytoskeletal protein [Acidimicrobiia bacterium]|nr:polymer-forming cytoskeletal protein [Acidimicrobiia bacterium]
MTLLTRTVGRTLFALVCATVIALVTSAAPAGAADADSDSDSEPQVSVTGPVRVGSDKRVDGAVVSVDGSVRVDGVVDGSVFVARGNVTIRGEVTGSVVVLKGDVVVRGRVGDEVIVFSGRAVIADGGRVTGDVSSSDKPRVAPGATVGGSVEEISLTGLFTAIGWALLVLWWAALTVSLAVLGVVLLLLFPRAGATVSAAGRSSIGACVGWGALVGLALPIVALGVSVTILGLPLGVGTLVALSVAYPVGYLATALVLGRLMVRRGHAIVAFLVGFAVLRAAAVIPGIGLLIGFLAAAYGLGVLAVSGWRAGRLPSAEAEPAPSAVATPTVEAPTVEAPTVET